MQDSPLELVGVKDHFIRFVSPSPEALADARAAMASFLAHGLSPELRSAVLLALDEIITNAVAHSGTDGSIVVHVSHEGGRVAATVRDSGSGFDPRCINCDCPPALHAEGGRGLYIAIQLMDSVTVYSDNGTIVHMWRDEGRRDGPSAAQRAFESEHIVRFAHRPCALPAA
jgi:anti-sigma regulatory factor (Ser/Thr protein kinase)